MTVTAIPGAISSTRYVNIISGVGANSVIPARQLIGRLFTDNGLLPPQRYKQFSSAAEVGAYFGLSSNEYLRALFYFTWVSKNITQANLISFARWVDEAVAGVIYGIQAAYVLSTFTAVTSGSLNLTIGGTTFQLTGINLSAASSLSVVASDIQTAIQAHTAGGTDWTSATVQYVASPTQGGSPQFVLTGGVVGAEAMGIAAATAGTDLGPLLGFLGAGAIVGQGSAIETITQTLTTSANLSNNFGSFLFMPSLNTTQITQAAEWNASQNNLYQFMVPVTSADYATVEAAIAELGGCGMTLSPIAGQYPEMIPMIVLAATNFNAVNGVQGYMFQNNFAVTPSVTTDLLADTYDAALVNYYGQTQSAGQFIQFYQRGVLTGPSTSPQFMNFYANEQWLKATASAALLTLLLSLSEVAANTQGQGQLTATMQGVIDQALTNGTISVGNILSTAQQLFITQVTGDPKAWYQVQTIGYWFNVTFQEVVNSNSGLEEWQALYTLVYAKNNQISSVQGTDILI